MHKKRPTVYADGGLFLLFVVDYAFSLGFSISSTAS